MALDSLRENAADRAAVYFGEQQLSTPYSDRRVAVQILEQLRDAPEHEEDLRRRAHELIIGAAAENPPAGLSIDPKEAKELAAWMHDFLPEPHVLHLCNFARTGRGLASGPAGLEAGEVALRIPEELVLTADHARMHALAGPCLAHCGAEVHEDVLLSFALLLETRPAWVRYRTMMPKRPPCALMWTPAQLQRMCGTPLAGQTEALRDALIEQHKMLLNLLQRAFVTEPQLEHQMNWDHFIWAYCIVESRGVRLALGPPGSEKCTCLVPILDMCNHSPSAALGWPARAAAESGAVAGAPDGTAAAVSSSAVAAMGISTLTAGAIGSGGVLEVRTLRPLAPGEEACLYYGPLACLQTLQHYGFIDAPMLAHEVTQIDLEYPDEEEEDAVGAAALHALRARLLAEHGLSTSPHFLRAHGEIAPRLLRALRILTMGAADLRACAALDPELRASALENASGMTDAAGALRSIAEGMAESLVMAAAASAEAAAAEGEGAVPGAVPDEADADVDAAIESYLGFQRRVLWHTLGAADALEAGHGAHDEAAGEVDEDEGAEEEDDDDNDDDDDELEVKNTVGKEPEPAATADRVGKKRAYEDRQAAARSSQAKGF